MKNAHVLQQAPRQFHECLGLGEKFSNFIIVSSESFTKRNLDRFGATWLFDHGKRVHLIDISLTHWGKVALENAPPDAVDAVFRPESDHAVKSFLQQYGERALLIPYVTPRMAMPLFKVMENYSISSLFYDSGRLPAARSLLQLFKAIIKDIGTNPQALIRRAHNRLESDEINVDYLVASGTACDTRSNPWRRNAGETIPAHSYDYVTWQASDPFMHSRPYIVFLDQNYTSHPHWKKLWKDNPFEGKNYYGRIENLLRLVSRRFDMPVLVALHPRSSDANEPAAYQGFQKIRDRTASLVKGAQLVVAHDTTAVSFAVLSRKPLLLVEVEERRNRLHIGNVTQNLSAALGAPVVDLLSSGLPKFDELDVDKSKYASYEALYIRHPACNGIPVWDRVFGSSAASSS